MTIAPNPMENQWRIQGKSKEIHRKSVEIHGIPGKSLENPRQSIENPWEINGNQWKIRRNPWKLHGKSAEILENSRKSIENPWKTHGNPRKIRGNPLKIMENPGKKLIWQRWPATWSSEPSCMLGYRNNLSMHSQNTPKKSVRNKKLTQESDPNN